MLNNKSQYIYKTRGKQVKKLVAIVLLISCVIMAGCGNQGKDAKESNTNENEQNQTTQSEAEKDQAVVNTTDATTIHIASLKGPTSIGMVKMMDEERPQYDFEIYATADEIVPLIISGKLDIANIPANLAAVLYARTNGKLKILDINTLGVLYMVGKDSSVQNFHDAKGRKIYMTGAGTTPEFALKYLLTQNGLSLDDFDIEYKTEATEVVSALANDDQALGILPQPYATVATTQIEGLKMLLNFTEEWGNVTRDSNLVTGVTVVRSDFLKEHQNLVHTFMNDLKTSIQYVNDNVDEMAASVEKYNIIKEAVAKKAIPYCNLTYIDGIQMKTMLSGYLRTLYEQDQASVGGSMPGDDFYYEH